MRTSPSETDVYPAIHPVTLTFADPTLEDAFRDAYRHIVGRTGRMALLVGLVLYTGFGLLDLLIVPAQLGTIWLIRYAVVCPYLLAAYALSFTEWWQRRQHALLIGAVLLGGFGIVGMIVLVDPPASYSFYAGPLLVIMFGYTLTRLRFLQATIACWLVTGAYVAGMIFVDPVPSQVLIKNGFFLVAVHVVGMVACYQLESHTRHEFYLSRELKAAAICDPLTGLLNRRTLDGELGQLIAQYHRHQIPFSLLMTDLDRFKTINDRWGHLAGDAVLREFSRVLVENVRDADLVIRFGGDEFLIVAPTTRAAESLSLATRLQGKLDDLVIPEFPDITEVHLSVGIVEMTTDIRDPRELLKRATIALHRAKSQELVRIALH